MKIVFVGGIHGVGKSTLCARIAAKSNVLHVKASSLIRDPSRNSDTPGQKLVQDVSANQAVLVARFREVMNSCTAQAILIDGHFALGKPDGTTERVAANVFAALRVSSLVCLLDAPSAVAGRLKARDASAPEESYLALLQAAELEQAANVSKAMGVRLSIVNALSAEGQAAVVEHLLEN